jgi:hypothetical protein
LYANPILLQNILKCILLPTSLTLSQVNLERVAYNPTLVHNNIYHAVYQSKTFTKKCKILQWIVMLWEIPNSININVILRNSVFIYHAARPPLRIKRQLNPIKFVLKIILIYWPSITNFIYPITINIFQNTTKEKESFFFFKRDVFYICAKLQLANYCFHTSESVFYTCQMHYSIILARGQSTMS